MSILKYKAISCFISGSICVWWEDDWYATGSPSKIHHSDCTYSTNASHMITGHVILCVKPVCISSQNSGVVWTCNLLSYFWWLVCRLQPLRKMTRLLKECIPESYNYSFSILCLLSMTFLLGKLLNDKQTKKENKLIIWFKKMDLKWYKNTGMSKIYIVIINFIINDSKLPYLAGYSAHWCKMCILFVTY